MNEAIAGVDELEPRRCWIYWPAEHYAAVRSEQVRYQADKPTEEIPYPGEWVLMEEVQ